MFRGVRGEAPIDEVQFAEIIVRLSTLLRFATEIKRWILILYWQHLKESLLSMLVYE